MTAHALDFVQSHPARFSILGIGAVLLAHLALLWLLVSLDVVPNPLNVRPLMVQMITAAPPQIDEPKPLPVQPSAVVKRPTKVIHQPRPTPVLATQTPQPSNQLTTSAPETAPPPPTEVEAAVPEISTSQPRFDADYLHNPPPPYPALSKRMGEEGKVFLRVFVEPDGKPGRVEIKTSSGSPRLDQAAEEAIWRWKFVPGKRGDEPVGAWVIVPISFNLKG